MSHYSEIIRIAQAPHLWESFRSTCCATFGNCMLETLGTCWNAEFYLSPSPVTILWECSAPVGLGLSAKWSGSNYIEVSCRL